MTPNIGLIIISLYLLYPITIKLTNIVPKYINLLITDSDFGLIVKVYNIAFVIVYISYKL